MTIGSAGASRSAKCDCVPGWLNRNRCRVGAYDPTKRADWPQLLANPRGPTCAAYAASLAAPVGVGTGATPGVPFVTPLPLGGGTGGGTTKNPALPGGFAGIDPATIGEIIRQLGPYIPGAIGGIGNLLDRFNLGPGFPFGGNGAGGNGAGMGDALSPLAGGALVTQPITQTVMRAPPGYVLVTRSINGVPTKFAVQKDYAKRLGLVKPRRKPPISAADWRRFKAAGRVQRKLENIACRELNMVKKKAPRRRSPSSNCKPKTCK